MLLKENTTASEVKEKFEEIAAANNWRLSILGDPDDASIGIEMEPYCFSWYRLSELSTGKAYLSYDHTYSQNTGATCKSYTRAWAKECKLIKKGFNLTIK